MTGRRVTTGDKAAAVSLLSGKDPVAWGVVELRRDGSWTLGSHWVCTASATAAS